MWFLLSVGGIVLPFLRVEEGTSGVGGGNAAKTDEMREGTVITRLRDQPITVI